MSETDIRIKKIEQLSKKAKLLILDISFKAGVGHVGSALCVTDILTSLYFSKHFRINKDKFVLSKGHAAAALYSVLHLAGSLSKRKLFSFAKDGGLSEHLEYSYPGVEMSAGSLGHGLSFAIGKAVAFKQKKVNGRIFVLISDGECEEGSVWEAALFASHRKLNNITAILDYNGWQCFGRTKDITEFGNLQEKWKSFGWNTLLVDGHNIQKIVNALSKSHAQKPTIIIAKTIAGKGIKLIENQQISHYKIFDEKEYQKARRELS